MLSPSIEAHQQDAQFNLAPEERIERASLTRHDRKKYADAFHAKDIGRAPGKTPHRPDYPTAQASEKQWP
jgi:hypothetical protein